MTAKVTVILPAPLRRLFDRCPSEVTVTAASVDELLDELDRLWPGMRDRLADSEPKIRRHINVFVDGSRSFLQTRLTEGAEVYVMTAISGG